MMMVVDSQLYGQYLLFHCYWFMLVVYGLWLVFVVIWLVVILWLMAIDNFVDYHGR